MPKALIDTSTYIDIRRASQGNRQPWAKNTISNLLAYRSEYPKLTLSVFTVYEILDGLYRGATPSAAPEFLYDVLPAYEVIYPDESIISIGAEINAALAKSGQTIGMADTLIAATAISRNLTLVNANTKHFSRVGAAGFAISFENWRDEPLAQ